MEDAMSGMTIGGVAKKAGIGVETIRFYERQGLISRPPKPTSGGFRNYPSETVERIRFIRQAQDLGFSLKEIEALLSLRTDPATDCAQVREQAQAKLEEVERKIARLTAMQSALQNLIKACPGTGAATISCSILEALESRGERARQAHDQRR
jgi:Hg(II)-responsive transcriptional regulator